MANYQNFRIKNGLTVGAVEVIDSNGKLTADAFGANSNEKIEDVVADMITGSTHSNITVTYNDTNGTLAFSAAAQYGDSDVESYLDGGTSTPSFAAVVATTVNTGQGANELYAMNQNVRTTDGVTFATVNTGQGANELYDMNQNVKTTDSPTFAGGEYTGTLTIDSGTAMGLRIEHDSFGNALEIHREDTNNAASIRFSNNSGRTGTLLAIHAETDLYWQKGTGTTNYRIWTEENDGPSSGLNADLLDDQHGSYYLNYNNFTNTPTIPSLSGYATESYVGTQISNLVDSSPAALNTLNELAAALGDDANFSTTVTNSIATKLPLAGGTMTGDINMNGNDITNIKYLQFNNEELTDFDGSMQMILDANDADTNVPKHGDYNAGHPFGIYFTGDGDSATTTLGSGLVKVWHTGHFKKAHIDYFVGLYNTGVTTTEYDYLDGVTSNIQTQLNGKQASGSYLTSSSGLNASNLTSGTVPDARIAASSITQHTDPKYLRSNANDTTSGNITITKTSPTLTLLDNNTSTGSFPAIEFETSNSQGVRLEHNEFDGELPVGGYGLVLKESSSNTQFPSTGTLSFNVLGEMYAGATSLGSLNRVFHDGYHPNADTLTTARTISLTGAVTGSVSFNGSSNVSMATTATADPTLTLSGDASGSATFTNLGNATLSVTVADDSHNHVLANVDRVALSSSNNLNDYNTQSIISWGSSQPTNSPGGYSTGFVLEDNNQPQQLVQTYGGVANNVKLYGRRRTSGNWDTTWTQYFSDHYHPNADTLTTARTISLTGAVTGSTSFDGSGNVSISTTATADPTLTLSGDVSGSATFTNLGNATLSVTVADDSHNHVISNVDGLQTALDAKAPTANPDFTGTANFGLITVDTNGGTSSVADEFRIGADNYDTGAAFSGVTIRPSDGVNPDAGGTLLMVRSGGGSPRWFVQHSGICGTSNSDIYVSSATDMSGGNRVFHDGYHPNADTLTTARTIAGTSFNGSANIDINYNNLTNKPTIPTNNNQLTNGAGYITGISSSQVTTALGYTPYQENTALSATSISIGSSTVIDSSSNLTNIANLGGGDGNFARLGRTYNTANYFEIGYGSGAVGLTINDGGGNAQLTFNHTDETADSNGCSARIRCDVDSSGADILFLLEDSVSSGFVETNNMTTALTVATGGISAAGNVTAYSSDRRLKENLKPIESPLEKINKLNGMTFDWKDIVDDLKFKPTHRKNDIGLIAQDVKAVMPQAVAPAPFDRARTEDGTGYYSKSGEEYMTVQLERLVPLLVEGMKEQQKQIEELKSIINTLVESK